MVLGILYPLVVTGVGQVAFPGNANGQQIKVDGKLVGSKIIGQQFADQVVKNGKPQVDNDGNPVTVPDKRYFQSRPSPTVPPYNAGASTFSNLGPNDKATEEAISASMKAYLKLEKPYDPSLTASRIPVDAVNTTGSGLDPDISPANADIQAHRIAAVRHLPMSDVSTPDLPAHPRPWPRVLGRARRQRAPAQPRPRQRGRVALMSVTAPERTQAPPASATRSRCSARDIVMRALIDSFIKLDPRVQIRNPVMFVVEIGAVITTVTWFIQVFGGRSLGGGNEPAWYTFTISFWLWLTVVFANMAEAFAEGRGRAQADTLRAMRRRPSRGCRTERPSSASELTKRRRRRRRGRRADPRRRHRDRGHRVGRRVGDHRRVGAGDPRVRRRPQRGHRRHAGAV